MISRTYHATPARRRYEQYLHRLVGEVGYMDDRAIWHAHEEEPDMGCNCGRNAGNSQVEHVVTLKDGTTVKVESEFAARVMVAKAGGGSYRKAT